MHQREKDLYHDLSSALDAKVQTTTPSEVSCKNISSDTVLIVDEADFCLLDEKMQVPKGAGLVIGFTATPVKTLQSTEADYLRSHSFKFFDSAFQSNYDLEIPEISLQDFMSETTAHIALIYCEDSFIP